MPDRCNTVGVSGGHAPADKVTNTGMLRPMCYVTGKGQNLARYVNKRYQPEWLKFMFTW